jgi:hypothetical protein
VILALASNAADVGPQTDKAVNEFAARGFRSLDVARADGDGLSAFSPPPSGGPGGGTRRRSNGLLT